MKYGGESISGSVAVQVRLFVFKALWIRWVYIFLLNLVSAP